MPLAQIQPVSMKGMQTHKQRIQTTKLHKPARIKIPLYKPVSIQIPQQEPAQLIPLQDHHIKWIQAPVYRYNKKLQLVI